jgi:hypothetical protein
MIMSARIMLAGESNGKAKRVANSWRCLHTFNHYSIEDQDES